jgi:hypothetical protein
MNSRQNILPLYYNQFLIMLLFDLHKSLNLLYKSDMMSTDWNTFMFKEFYSSSTLFQFRNGEYKEPTFLLLYMNVNSKSGTHTAPQSLFSVFLKLRASNVHKLDLHSIRTH